MLFLFCVGIATLLVFFCKYYILSWFRNVDHGLGCTTIGVTVRLLVWCQQLASDGWR